MSEDTKVTFAENDFYAMLEKMTPDEVSGAIKVSQWFRRNYRNFQFKRLGRIIVDLTQQDDDVSDRLSV
jgi:hypothetical protein